MRKEKAELENPLILAYWVFETGRIVHSTNPVPADAARCRGCGMGPAEAAAARRAAARRVCAESGRLARSLGLALVASPLVLDTLEDFADRRARESARGEKARLLRTLGLAFPEAGRISCAKRLGHAPVRSRATGRSPLRSASGRPRGASTRRRSGWRQAATRGDGPGSQQNANRTTSPRFQANRAKSLANRSLRRRASACARVRRGCIRGGTGSRARGLSANGQDVGIFRRGPVIGPRLAGSAARAGVGGFGGRTGGIAGICRGGTALR